jgi:hypothetical protein
MRALRSLKTFVLVLRSRNAGVSKDVPEGSFYAYWSILRGLLLDAKGASG